MTLHVPRLRVTRPRRFLWAAALLLIWLAGAASAGASELWLPKGLSETLAATLERDCPTCLDRGLVPCGDADVSAGRRFAAHFFQDGRGYFLTFTMAHAAFRAALVERDRAKAVAALTRQFAETRLIVVDGASGAARVLPRPDSVEVIYAPAQHRCLGIERRPWSCCLGDGGADPHCLPKADSPHVRMAWTDLAAGEELVATYVPMPGFSRLVRRGAGETPLYYCLSDEPGRLKTR